MPPKKYRLARLGAGISALLILASIAVVVEPKSLSKIKSSISRRQVLGKVSEQASEKYELIIQELSSAPANTFLVSVPSDASDDSLADGIFYPPTFRAAVENANRFADLDMIDLIGRLLRFQKIL